MVRHGAFAYTWDLVGDPSAAARIAGLGVDTVTLQAAYHSVRATTAWHPAHRMVHADHAAAYFRIRPERWRGLRPPAPSWGVEDVDPFGTATAALTVAGLRTEAWVVLTHSSALGRSAPELAVHNAYNEVFSYALCPAQPAVHDYALTIIQAIVDRELQQGIPAGSDLTDALGAERANAIYTHRREVITGLVREAAALAGRRELLLMATDDPQVTGPDVGVRLAGFEPAPDGFVLKCWDDEEAVIARLKTAATRTGVPLIANVNAVGDRPEDLPALVKGIVAAGVSQVRYYHAGLASPARQAAIRAAVQEVP
jgi:hypothetical protein